MARRREFTQPERVGHTLGSMADGTLAGRVRVAAPAREGSRANVGVGVGRQAVSGEVPASASSVADHEAATDPHAGYLREAVLTTKGDLYARDGSTVVRVGVGSDGQVLTADAAESAGVKWATPASGGSASEDDIHANALMLGGM